jgi:hypothetical protein
VPRSPASGIGIGPAKRQRRIPAASNARCVGRAKGQHHTQPGRSRRRKPRRTGAREPYRWTDVQLEAELRAFTEECDEFPTGVDFDAANRGDLRSAVNELGGPAYWADVVGLPLPASRLQTPYETTDAIRDAQSVIAALGYLPGEPTLRRLGYGKLATRVRQTRGGAAAFVVRHGLAQTDTAA